MTPIDTSHLLEAGLVALVTFIGAWAGLRITVTGLKDGQTKMSADVEKLGSLVVIVELLKAKSATSELEQEKLRNHVHEQRTYIQDILIRVGKTETRLDALQKDVDDIEETP